MAAEGEHGEGDQGVGDVEAERDAGDESDLGVDRFDPAVGQAVLDRGEDRGPVFHDPALQVDEGGDAAAAGPADPVVERRGCLGRVETEDQPEAFFEQVGPVQPGVGLGDPGELGLLLVGEVLRVLPQRVPGMLQRFGVAGRRGRPRRRVTAPRAAFQACRRTSSRASVAHCTTWNGSAQRTAFGQRFATTVAIQSAPSAETWVI